MQTSSPLPKLRPPMKAGKAALAKHPPSATARKPSINAILRDAYRAHASDISTRQAVKRLLR